MADATGHLAFALHAPPLSPAHRQPRQQWRSRRAVWCGGWSGAYRRLARRWHCRRRCLRAEGRRRAGRDCGAPQRRTILVGSGDVPPGDGWTGNALYALSVLAAAAAAAPASSSSPPPPGAPGALSELASKLVSGLTFFMGVWGFVSFIRRSTQQRAAQSAFTMSKKNVAAAEQYVGEHLEARSFAAKVRETDGTLVYEGVVRPSFVLTALFVAFAAGGFYALAVVLQSAFHTAGGSGGGGGGAWYGLVALSPLVGVYYWRGSFRTEQIRFRVSEENAAGSGDAQQRQAQQMLLVRGHRDEIAAMQRALGLSRHHRKA